MLLMWTQTVCKNPSPPLRTWAPWGLGQGPVVCFSAHAEARGELPLHPWRQHAPARAPRRSCPRVRAVGLVYGAVGVTVSCVEGSQQLGRRKKPVLAALEGASVCSWWFGRC